MKEYKTVEIFAGRQLLDSIKIWGYQWEVVEKAKDLITEWEQQGYIMVNAKVDGEEIWK